VRSAAFYRPQCVGINPPKGVWCHITGSDLVRHSDGRIYVLEDNLRVPSGVSYMLENRDLMKRTFPQVFEGLRVRTGGRISEPAARHARVDGARRRHHQAGGGAAHAGDVQLGLLRAQLPGAEDGHPARRRARPGGRGPRGVDAHHQGLRRVHVIYRRIDDDFLDPETFRKDSLLGVPGLVSAYRAGKVSLANAPGNGVADDKVMYAYVPEMIRYYEGEDPIIPNVPTYLCWRDTDRQHVLQNLETLVVKAANEAGGYGMLVGPALHRRRARGVRGQDHGEPAQLHRAADARSVARADARRQPARRAPRGPAPLHPLRRRDPRGARRPDARRAPRGSLVVNSSQGGGSKDTWVLE
jgi:uncharacterized circularly permuted ATP-grasp superfamily protein